MVKIGLKRTVAILLAVMLVVSTIPIALANNSEDGVLVQKDYNIAEDLNTYAIKENNIHIFDKKDGTDAYVGLGIKGRYGVKNSPSANTQAYLTWYSEAGYNSFTVFTNNYKSGHTTYLDTAASYKLSWSSDNVTFTEINTVENKGFTLVGTGYVSYELCATGIPKEAKYMKLTMICPKASEGWKYAVNKISYTYYEKLPELTVKTADGAALENAAITDKNVIISTKNLKEEQITILKDGNPYNMPEGFLFTENGAYSISAENDANQGNPIVFSFEINKPALYKLSYNLLKDNADGAFKVEGDIVTEDATKYENYLNYFNGEYFVHLSNASNATASYYWHSESGFESFTVFTKNEKANIQDYLNLEGSYKLYWSKDNITYTELSYVSLGSTPSGTGYLSYELAASYIPDEAKYIRLTLKNPSNTSNWRIGLDGFAYEVLLQKPTFVLQAETSSGNITLGNKGVSGSDVMVSYNFIEVSDITATKNGNAVAFPENAVFTEDGEYTLSATNAMGTTSIGFTIEHKNPQDFVCDYIFDSDETNATDTFNSLLNSPSIDGAPEDFANGDGSLVINSESNLNDKWWSYEDGGTKLTLGKGSDYAETGYFYFKNSGSDGKKYTGISFTYSVAAKSGYPKDQKIIISVSDSYDGKFTKVTPVSHIENKTISGSMVKIYTDVYYLGGTDKIVKVEFVANTLITARWHAAALSMFSLSKLQMPIIEVKSDKAVENYGVATQDVNYSISNYFNYEILRNGEPYTPSVEGILNEDGDYVIKANNIVGECNWNFTIAKENPAIILRDTSGAAISSDSIQDDDVTVGVFNAKSVTVTRDGSPFELPQSGIIDLNGVYVITVENEGGITSTKKVTLARALPSIDVVDYDGKVLSNGVVSNTYIDVMVKKADSVIVKKNGNIISMPTANHFTTNGEYTVEAINKAGSVVFHFTVNIASALAEIKHSGDTVQVVDYDNGSKKSIYQFATNYMTSAKFPDSALSWIGINSAMLRPEKTALQTSVIYRCNNFKSFGVWAILHPEITDLSNYKIYASSDGVNFKEITYSVEKDESYISKGTPSQKGYSRHRLVAQSIPAGTNYIKVEIDSQHTLAHAFGIQKVEFSFNKAEQGTINYTELENVMANSNDGQVIPIVVKNEPITIPASVFESFMGFDVTLKLIVVDDDLNPVFCYNFVGSKINLAGDVELSINDETSDKFNSYGDIKVFTTLNQGDWDMEVTLGAYMNGKNYTEYYLYTINDSSISTYEKTFIDGDCAYFKVLANHKYVLSDMKGLNKNEAFIALFDFVGEETNNDPIEDNEEQNKPVDNNTDDTKEENNSENSTSTPVKLPKGLAIALLVVLYLSTITCAGLLIIFAKPKK